MNRRSSFGQMLAGSVLAVCFLPVMLRAEGNVPAPEGQVPQVATGMAAASRLTAVETTAGTGEVRVFLETSGKVDAHSFVLESPDRLVVDLPGVESAVEKNRIEVDSPYMSRVRVGQRQEGATPVARVVLDLKHAQPYTVEPAPGGVVVTVGGGADQAQADGSPAGALDPPQAAPAAAPMRARTEDPSPAMADTAVMHDSAATAPSAKAEMPPAAAPAMDGDTAAPVLVAQGAADMEISQAERARRGDEIGNRTVVSSPQGATFESKQISPATQTYTGKKISLNLVDADIKQVFRLFHEISGLNFVLDPGVSGSVTIVLDEVPWDQALDLILKNNGLDKVYEDNVIRIASTQKLATEASGRKALKEAKELELEPVTITRRLSYAKAKDIDAVIKAGVLLSTRGKSFFDDRTNTLIVTDVPTKVVPLDHLITDLDSRTPQVMIEARIVLTGRDFIQNLGVNWGFLMDHNPPQNAWDHTFPNHGEGSVGVNTTGDSMIRALTRGTGAFNLFNKSGSFRLNILLDALETDGTTRTLSAPKIATQNNVKAEIEQGVQIPIQIATAVANNVQFVSASLRLSVTPQITAEGTVIMDITVENNSPSSTIVVQQIPGIDTQRATTKVMVEDGGTTVIGGIFQVKDVKAEEGWPWLRKIPVFGWLFKTRQISTQNRELLIFITPKILGDA